MQINFSKYGFLLCLGLLAVQAVFAQNESIDDCAAEIDNDPDTPVDIDDDDDGLIELCYLEDVSGIRDDLDGTSIRRINLILRDGCPDTGCNGYELVRDLDFMTTQSYVDGVVIDDWVLSDDDFTGTTKRGWVPIGSIANNDCTDSSSRCFAGILEGNGYRISNLHINRDNSPDLGLFTGNAGTMRNLGLSAIKIEGSQRVGGLVASNQGNLINVHVDEGNILGGNNAIGLLVGRNESNGLIINSYVHGTVSSAGSFVGGIGGLTLGRIINSYAIAEVSAVRNIGGLTGDILGFVVNSYAMGSANLTADAGADRNIGGLASTLWVGGINPSITNSYSTVAVTATNPTGNNLGGLIARKFSATLVVDLPVNDSYWDTTMSGRSTSRDGTGRTTEQLQMPTNQNATMGIYANWSSDDWDFGDEESYPALRYVRGDDNDNPACDVDPDTPLPPCGAVLSGQTIRDKGLSILFFVVEDEQQDNARVFRDQPFSPLQSTYDIKMPPTTRFQLIPYAINSTETISITKQSDTENTDYFDDKNSGELSNNIMLQAGITEVVTITAGDVTYGLNIEVGPANRLRIVRFDSMPGADNPIDEKQPISLTVEVADGRGNYAYSLQQGDTVLEQRQSMNVAETFNVVIPPDFVATERTTQNIVYTITVADEFETVPANLRLIANKENNGTPQLKFVNAPLLSVISIADDPDGVGTFTYQWQRQITSGGSWTDISNANLSTFAVNAAGTIRYRVMVDHTDGQGNMSSYTLGPSVIDVDRDDDGLIEIYYLDNLNAIRNQLDGSGYTASGGATRITTGCPDTGCNGYELVGDLDFTTTQSYVSGVVNDDWVLSDDDFTDVIKRGWSPLGNFASNAVFEGNGYSISNLPINREGTDNIGLFSRNRGTIRNVGLSEIRVEGNVRVGGVVSVNEGRLMNVYVDGDSSIAGLNGSAGLLTGDNESGGLIINSYARGAVLLPSNEADFGGSLCGNNQGSIINSHADANILSQTGDSGGLVGRIDLRGSVINSYVVGVVFDTNNNDDVGGLIGVVDFASGRVSNSYSIAEVGNTNGGGLIGENSGSVRDSYWDTETSGRTRSAGGTGLMTAQLQMPTGTTGIYANWSSDDWDFGDASSYPALRYARGDDNNNPACDVVPDTPLPPCGAVLSGQTIRDRGLSTVFFVIGDVQLDNARVFQDQPFSPLVFDYDIRIPGRPLGIALRPYAINDTATISVSRTSDRDTPLFMGRDSGDLSDPIVLEAGTTATIRVRVDGLTYNFNLIRGSQSPVEVISFGTIPSTATVSEGDDIRLQAVFGNGSGDYEYSLRQRSRLLAQGQGTTATITPTVPDNFVAADRTTQSIVYTITVDDGFDITSGAVTLTVNKGDNGAPQLRISVSPTELLITSAVPDPDGVGTFSYQWQSRDMGDNDWTDVSGDNPYTVPGAPASTIRYRAIVNHTDGQRYMSSYTLGPFPIDVDPDDDGLIDVHYLEDLDAIRYQLDGSGYGLAAVESKITSGCPTSTCAGYELLRDLDFTTTRSYVDVMSNRDNWTVDDPTDTGWLPIATTATPFTSLFNGNNNNISNLQINRDTIDGSIGLFAALSSEARLENVGLLNVAIEGRGYVGSLVARNEGAIVNSYAQGGEITGTQHSLGGLVAINVSSATSVIINSYANVITTSTEVFSPGGLVGRNRGVIRNSYASGDVSGPCDVGGLVAESFVGSEIVNSYASGNVHRTGGCMDDGTLDSAGGLVGYHRGLLKNSYASGRVSGSGAIGGLVGDAENSTVEFSYWDSTVNSDITADDEDGIATSTVALQTPQSAEGIYADWSSDDWDFGTAMQYPLLRYTSPTDIAIAPVCDDDLDTALPPCGSVLLAQAESGLSNLLFFVGDAVVAPDPPFSLSILSYAVNVENTNTIELLPYGINPQNESIAIRRVGDPDTDYSEGSGERSLPIPLSGGASTLEIVVGTIDSVTYRITVTNTVDQVVVEEIIAPDTVSEEDAISLSATVTGGARTAYRYRWTSTPTAFLAGQDRTAATLSFNVPADFVSRDATGRDVEITLTVGDGLTNSRATRTVTVTKADNGQPSFTETVTVSSISIAIVPGSDLDGDGTIDRYTWQRRSVGDTEWTTIADQTSAMFNIPPQDDGGTLYRVQVMSTDAQGNGFTSILGPYRNRTDIDDDDDGLIDIYYLEDLDAVRHQTDGSGYGTTDITRGCRLVGDSETCMGYELRRDLDFASTPSYVNVAMNRAAWTVDNFATAGDSGWDPIGSVAGNDCTNSSSDCFASVFEGNGFNISNLHINRDGTDEIGLFAGNRNTGTIRNLGLREIEVEGNNRVGGLVGRNEGNLINTHVVEGRVEGAANNVGLLVGVSRPSALIINSYVRGTVAGSRWVGGICGLNFGRIINSYAEVMASGQREVGGLAAENQHGTIRNSYAMGSAHITSNDSENRRSVGGLIAVLWRVNPESDNPGPNPSVTNSYSTVAVTGNLERNNVGGLIGNTNISDPLITASYWDTDMSERTASPGGGTPQTTDALQMPTAPGTSPTAVYYQWSTADWDFGTSRTYAALKYNEVAGVDACDTDAATPLPRCRSLLPGQRAEPVGENTAPTIMTDASLMITLVENAVTALNIVINDEDNDALSVTVASSAEAIATAMVSGAGGTRVLEIRGVGVGDATLTVTVDDGRGEANSMASLVFMVSVSANLGPMITLIPSTAQSLPVNTMTDTIVSVADSNFDVGDIVTLTAVSSAPSVVSVMPERIPDIRTDTNRTFMLNARQGGIATITFTAEDSGGLSDSADLSVRVNTPPTRNARVPTRAIIATVDVPFELGISDFFSDADGDTLTYGIAIEPPSGLIDNFSTMTGVWTFTATDADASTNTAGSIVTVSADDGRGGRVQASFTLLIDAPLTGTVRMAPDGDDRWLLRTMSMFADANGIATTSYEWFRVIDGSPTSVGSDDTYTIPESNDARAAGTSYRLEVTVRDNIEQSVTTQSNVYTVPNIAPMITQVNVVPSTTTEGRTVRMTATASDENFDGLDYRWRVSGISADEADVSGETAPLTIRDYFVTDATAATATAVFMVTVSDGTTTTIGRFSVEVNKEDNGVVSVNNLTRSPTTETRLIFTGIDETTETDGGVRDPVTYHWQQCLGSLGRDCSTDAVWQNIVGQTGTLGNNAIFYEVPDMLSTPENHQVRSGDRFRVRIAYTDLQDYPRSVYSSNLGARLGQNTTPTIRVADSQDTDITLLEGGRITVPVSVRDRDGGALNVAVVSADDAIASATISGDGATRTLAISGEGAGETMITATVDDGTGEVNATASIVFNVVVVENTTPTLMLEPSSAVTLPINTTTDTIASVADGNFDLGDIVTLTAVSSTPSVVSVMPVQFPNITTDTSATFVLNAEQGGVSMITFVATDRDGLEARAELAVRVNTAPTLSGIPSAPFRLLAGVGRELVLTIADADADDLTIRIDTDDSMIATATIIATTDAMRTLAVRGIGAGNAMITVTVDDGRGVTNSEVSERFAVQVEASEAPTIDIVDAPRQAIEPGSTAHIVVRVSDANFDFGDRVTLTAESSSRTIVSVMPQRSTDITDITTNTTITFIIRAEQNGEATITFTATDRGRGRLSDSEIVSVNVSDAAIGIRAVRIRAKVFLEGPLQ